MAQVWIAAWATPPGPARVAGLVGVVGVVVTYATCLYVTRIFDVAPRAAVGFLALQIGFVLLAVPATHAVAFEGLVFVGVSAIFLFRRAVALLVPAVGVVVAFAVPRLAGWQTKDGLITIIAFTGLAVFAFMQLIEATRRLSDAQEEVATLAATNERERLARDVHDVLGHSLTVIAVKAELAGRMLATDPGRGAAEVAEIRSLARTALSDVRGMVSGSRSVTLAGELANCRTVLDSAGIVVELPGAVDVVPAQDRELYAWVVREGTTNVLRHAGASRVRITITCDSVVVEDDGRGCTGDGDNGSGLDGLAARARTSGARIETGRSELGGFRLALRTRADDAVVRADEPDLEGAR